MVLNGVFKFIPITLIIHRMGTRRTHIPTTSIIVTTALAWTRGCCGRHRESSHTAEHLIGYSRWGVGEEEVGGDETLRPIEMKM